MNNLHISLNEFGNASRVLKQANSLVNSGLVEQVYIASLWADGLQEQQVYADKIICNRFKIKSRSWSKSFAVQVFKYFEFCWRVYRFYKTKNIKLVNIHSLGLLPLGVFLKWAYKAKLVYDTHELETETNGLTGFRKKLSKKLEKLLIKKADLTLVVSENIADWYATEYKMSRPPVVKNAPWAHTPAKTDVFRKKFAIRDEQTIFLYQGGLAKGRGVPFILEAFKARTNDQAVIVFMGYGALEEEIIQASKETNTIFYMPAVPPEQVLEHTVAADIGLSLIENTCLSYFYCMPNKLFEYSMAGLAVVVSNMKEMAEFVTQNNSGFVLDDMTVEALNNLIEQVLVQDLQQIKENARKAALSNSWEVQEKIMLDAYVKLLKVNK